MKSEWDRKIIFAKINKRKLRPLFLGCKKTLEEETKRKMSALEVARIVLLFGRSGKNPDKMTAESLEELLYLIEVCQ